MDLASPGCTVLRADAHHLPLSDDSVDLVVTSPPYYALRSYTDRGQHYSGQIGAEPTPAAYIANLIACTAEWTRVLKPGGSIFVNLGDKYSGAQAQNVGGTSRAGDSGRTWRQTDPRRTGVPNKSLMLLPERYRIAAVDELGLIARAVLVWSKPNGLPESVQDRVRRSHEDWVHLTKHARYFSAVDKIREPSRPQSGAAGTFRRAHPSHDLVPGQAATQHRHNRPDVPAYHPLGRLPGSVWEIATQPLRVPAELGIDHFAAFPMEWPRRLILGWSPPGICTACGQGRVPVVSAQRILDGEAVDLGQWKRGRAGPAAGVGNWRFGTDRRVVGEACGCPDTSALTRPAVVLDPFGGTGTTALVASVLGRHGISVDMSADYCRLARWRTSDPQQRARAAQTPKQRRIPAPRRTQVAPDQPRLL